MRKSVAAFVVGAALLVVGFAGAAPGTNVRLSNDCAGTCGGAGYVSVYTMNTGVPYTDATLTECTRSFGRQNEPAVEIDPRNTQVILGSSNDYCGTYNNGVDANGAPIPAGPIWLGYYRSQDAGQSFVSSLVPGYPGDKSPYAALSQARTASSGDPVIAWDAHGRAFFGSETSDDPAGTKKTIGDVFVARFRNSGGEAGPTINDGKEYYGTTVIARGSSAPNLLGKFNDKTAIEADRTLGRCDGNVYFSWSRFTGSGTNNIYFSRSTDHGVTFSNPLNLTPSVKDVQFPDISVTGNGNVYVTYRQYASTQGHADNAVQYVKSTDCGKSFTRPQSILGFIQYDAQDIAGPQPTPAQTGRDDPPSPEDEAAKPGSTVGDCGDFDSACKSGYTFFRKDTQPRSTADQSDKAHEWIYIVYDPTKPGTEVPTGTTYGSIEPGTGSQSAIYFTRFDGASGTHTTPIVLDNQPAGLQLFPDISASGGKLHALWWDTRLDSCYSPMRPVGNCADGSTVAALDIFATSSQNAGATWSTAVRVTDVTSNGNYEQFAVRTIPFAGDYLWISSVGDFSYGVWTDWRDTKAGDDQRETETGSNDAADVFQCRTMTASSAWTSDTCPRDGGLDQNIYGGQTP
ncbi:MAG: exo-alpha-sialidase [Actinobacteria bacterium]|nr:MAG: exo-alpha-sialidase [Actinomycetota bacterium]